MLAESVFGGVRLAPDRDRVMVRLSPAEFAMLDALCVSANVGLGGLLRECGLRYGASVIREVEAGSVVIRRRDGSVPRDSDSVPVREAVVVPPVSRPRSVSKGRSKSRPAAKPIVGLKRASDLVVEGGTQADWDLARQAKLNEARVRPAKKGKRGGS
jgi:hypothetical protein